jgi:amidase
MGQTIGPWSTATEMLVALEEGSVSSVELVEAHLARIEAHDGVLNAIPVRTPERAIEAARRADALRAGAAPDGAAPDARLLGVPVTLKESTQTAGLPQSAGLEPFRDHRPATDGPLAARVLGAGACLLGKTNIPVALGDWQADSPVYGRCNNPWDLDRTPGGSTGGGAAALAAGLTPLEIGSDIGGSIRVPAAYCGVYGHRPSETAIPRTGAFPLADAPTPGALMGVQGPLARSAADLELLFDVVAGPEVGEDAAWRLELPRPRASELAGFRVAVMPPLELAEPSAAMTSAVDELATFLRSEGATVATAMPDVDQQAYFHDYCRLLGVMTSQGQPPDARREVAAKMRGTGDDMLVAQAEGLTIDAHDFLALLRRREQARAAWRSFFRDWDVLVCPTALDVAFEHQTAPQAARSLDVDGRRVPYFANIVFPMWAIFTGQPATAFPAGLDPAGLPVGLQAIGPYLEDRTTLRFAQLLERTWRSFQPPPGWE